MIVCMCVHVCVAAGATCTMLIQPWATMLTGSFAGFVSVYGFNYIQTYLTDKLGLLDTCGIHNLHGMPSIIGAIASVIAAGAVPADSYSAEGHHRIFESSRGSEAQAWHQFAAMGITLAFAIVGGALTALLMNWFATPVSQYNDHLLWEVPDEQSPQRQDRL
eukprot:m.386996 g.386996  ORF g.386996 m.386996 type:complete len:162 (-) comp56308_c0_seq15:1693-2178(-)